MNITRKLWLSIGTMATGVVLTAVLLSGAFRSIHRTLSATATGSLVSVNVTQPGGAIWLGNHLWVSDQLQGFCRIDAPANAQAGATVYDPGSPDYCYNGNPIPGLVAGIGGEGTGGNFGLVLGQAAFDPGATYNYIYLPDRSSQSLGVWRVEYDALTETIRPGSGLVLASGTVLAGLRTSAVAVGPDGNLYVGSLTTGTIMRVPDPSGPIELQIPEAIGLSLSKRVYGMTFFGGDLMLATKDGVERIRNATACAGACTAEAVPGFPAVETTAIATDGVNWLYAAQPPGAVYEDNMGTGVVAELVNTGLLPLGMTFPISVDPTMGCIDLTCPFSFPVGQNSGLAVASDGNLYVADDPGATVTTGFTFSQRGRGWEVNPNQAPPVAPPPAPAPAPAPVSPTVDLFAPLEGLPGDAVTLTGTGFTAGATVSFNGTAGVVSTVSADGLTITTSVPAGATTGAISVTTPDGTGTSAASFTVLAPAPAPAPVPVPSAAVPVVSGFAPASGQTGATVQITGSGFTADATVSFNGAAGLNFVFADATSVTVDVPAGATSGPITVTGPAGSGASGTPFTVLPPAPTVSGFTPASGLPGDAVTISGTGFTSGATISFNGAAGVVASVAVGGTTITANVPAAATSGAITVANAGGSATSAASFTVLVPPPPPPAVGGFAPKTGLPGTVVTITGSGFTGATGVSFGTSAAAFVTVLDDTTLTAVVPDPATSGSVTVTGASGTGGSAASFQALQTCNTTISIPALPSGRTYWVQFTAHSTSTIKATWTIPVLQSVQLLLYTGNPFFGKTDPVAQGPTGKPLVVQNTNKTLDLNISMGPLAAGTYTVQFFNASNSFGATTGTISYINTAESPCAASPTTKNVIL